MVLRALQEEVDGQRQEDERKVEPERTTDCKNMLPARSLRCGKRRCCHHRKRPFLLLRAASSADWHTQHRRRVSISMFFEREMYTTCCFLHFSFQGVRELLRSEISRVVVPGSEVALTGRGDNVSYICLHESKKCLRLCHTPTETGRAAVAGRTVQLSHLGRCHVWGSSLSRGAWCLRNDETRRLTLPSPPRDALMFPGSRRMQRYGGLGSSDFEVQARPSPGGL